MGKAKTRRSCAYLTSTTMVYCPNPDCACPHNPQQDPKTARYCQTCGTILILPGELSQYRLVSVLGKGGFGRTFLAEQLEEKRASRCVVKQLYGRAIAETSDFQAEADRLRKLGEHPQIPRLIEALDLRNLDPGLGQCLVQEFAPGENLQQQVEKKGPWDEAAVRSLLISLVKVLQYVHSFGIIHRDIKPENVVAENVVASSSPFADINIQAKPSGEPMLVDFGSAKWIRQMPAQTVIGSAGYAPPEQSMGQATFASDLYSLGLTCLYLLTGVHPFQLYSAGEDRWVWQDYLSAPIDPFLVQVLNKMVERSLQQRYESANQVAVDLQGDPNSLLNRSQQFLSKVVFSKVKEIAPNFRSAKLKNMLGSEGAAVLEKFSLGARSLTPSENKPALPTISAAAKQRWVRVHRLAPSMGLTKAIAISLDAQYFATGGSDSALRLWQLSTAKLVHTFTKRRVVGSGHRGSITAIAIHPDNRALYTASVDGTIKEWDVANRQLLNTIDVGGWTPNSIAITPEGTQLVSANQDGKIVVWEIASLLPTAQLTQHQRSVNAISMTSLWKAGGTRAGSLLASASDDGTIKLWKTTQRQAKPQILQLAQTINVRRSQFSASQTDQGAVSATDLRALCVLLDSLSDNLYQLVVALSNGSVWLYQLDRALTVLDAVCLHRFSYPIRAMAMSPSASSPRCLAVGTEDRLLTLWRLDTLECVAELAHGWGVSAIAFTPDGRQLITASDDETISIWRRDT